MKDQRRLFHIFMLYVIDILVHVWITCFEINEIKSIDFLFCFMMYLYHDLSIY